MDDGRPAPRAFRRAADFLGLRRRIVGLLSMVVLVGMGEHMAEQFLPLYLLAAFSFGVAGTLWFAWKGRDVGAPAVA